MGQRKGIIITLIVLILIGIACFVIFKFMGNGETPIDNPGDNPIDIAKDYASTITVETSSKRISTDKIDLKIETPVIKNLTGYSFQAFVNSQVEESVNPYVNEIQTVLDDETPATTLYRYIVNYNRYNNGDYLSLVINQSYQTDGIRSNVWKDTYTINARSNTMVYVKDLFAANVDFEKAILREINTQAVAKNYELVGGNGISNIPEKQKFYIEDRKLIIYFDPAAIAPYVYGELRFEMPFTLNENGLYEI